MTFRSSCGIALAHWPRWSTGPGRITVTRTSSHRSGICNVIAVKWNRLDFAVLPPSLRRLCFYTCLSVHGGGGGGYPSMHCRSPGPHPGGKLRGLAWGVVSRPTPGGSPPGPHWGGVSRPTPGGLQAHTQHALRQAYSPTAVDGYCCGWYASYWNAFLFLSNGFW